MYQRISPQVSNAVSFQSVFWRSHGFMESANISSKSCKYMRRMRKKWNSAQDFHGSKWQYPDRPHPCYPEFQEIPQKDTFRRARNSGTNPSCASLSSFSQRFRNLLCWVTTIPRNRGLREKNEEGKMEDGEMLISPSLDSLKRSYRWVGHGAKSCFKEA